MRIRYFGWSGVAVEHAETLVAIDLAGEKVGWGALNGARTVVLCATHGHPDHLGTYRKLLADPEARDHVDRTHFVASRPVVDHVEKRSVLPGERLHVSEPGDELRFGEVRLRPFTWRHLPLLPPGIWEKADYLVQLMRRPVSLARIAVTGLRLPMRAPTHGFHVTYSDGCTVLDYGEGLHRKTDPVEVREVARRLPANVLLFAVEPEEVEALPRWIEILDPSTVLIYEAHRPWRELFDLPYVDLEEFAADLARLFPERSVHALVEPGRTVTV